MSVVGAVGKDEVLLLDLLDESLAFFLFDLAVEGDKLLRADSVVLQKDGRVPRVLAGDDVAFLQDAYGAVSDVLEVSYRRADQVDDAFFFGGATSFHSPSFPLRS